MTIYKEALLKILARNDLTETEAHTLMLEILNGQLVPEQIAGLLTALVSKGESLAEVTGFVKAMREVAVHLKSPQAVVDTCGTGGDGAHTFNISTTAAFVAAGAGVPVAKHHNRSVSSKCGSADLLEALGVDIQMPLPLVEQSVNELGLGFCFAPLFHPSMRHAAPARKALGIRTIFNLLGPMLNPFQARRQVIGVYAPDRLHFVAELLRDLGSERVVIVHGSDGLDEATLTGSTRIVEVDHGAIKEFELDPRDLGFGLIDGQELVGGDAEENKAITLAILSNQRGPRTDITILNAALALYVSREGLSLQHAVEAADEAIASGAALSKLEELRNLSRESRQTA